MSFTPKLKLLVICSKNQWRSPTAERIYQHDSRIEVRSAGTSQHAKHRVSVKDIEWADLIACMETKHKQYIQRTFDKKLLPQIVVFNIEDQYQFMDVELVDVLHQHIEQIIETSLSQTDV